jgi:hypothetical protein
VKSRIPKALTAELIARALLAGLAIAALVLAGSEDREAIGTALVGAAIAFGLAAAFFDRVIEVSTKGVKLADIRVMEIEVERQAPRADPEEKEELVEEGSEILATKRSAGESITPDLALGEASLTWRRNGLAAELHFANWLLERGWAVQQGERIIAATQPDLVAEKDGRRLAVEIKVGRRPIGVGAVQQALAHAAAVEAIAPSGPDSGAVLPVLVLGEISLSRAATVAAADREISVYLLDADNRLTHITGPELE